VRRLLAALLLPLALALPAAAQDQVPVTPPAPAAPPVPEAEWVPRTTAELQLLDKVTARISVLRAPLNQTVQFGTLAITVRACNARPPDEVPDAVAWLEVTDDRRPPERRVVFRGWMFANAPAVSVMEHPVYDLRVLECK
jgi:hypothetical protein